MKIKNKKGRVVGTVTKTKKEAPQKRKMYVLTTGCDMSDYFIDESGKLITSINVLDDNWNGDEMGCLLEHYGIEVIHMGLDEILDEDALYALEDMEAEAVAVMVAWREKFGKGKK